MTALCQIRLFGTLTLFCGDQTVTRFRTQQTAALFAFLAFYPDTPHARDFLIEQFWPNVSSAAGRNQLSVALSSLRKIFGDFDRCATV